MTDFPKLDAARVVFMADAHFGSRQLADDLDRQARFFRFLESLPGDTHLFLLGDLFDFYFEYGSVVDKRFVRLLAQLRAARDRGVRLHFIGGNHDHWVGKQFRSLLDVEVYREEIRFSAQGRKVVCAHGDLVMPRDYGYKVLKTVIRNSMVVGLSRWIHPDLLAGIAERVSSGSRNFMPKPQDERARMMSEHAHQHFFKRGNDAFIMGHVHWPHHDRRDSNDFFIVGDWITQFTYVELVDGTFWQKTFTG